MKEVKFSFKFENIFRVLFMRNIRKNIYTVDSAVGALCLYILATTWHNISLPRSRQDEVGFGMRRRPQKKNGIFRSDFDVYQARVYSFCV